MVIKKRGSSKQTGKTGRTRQGPRARHIYRKSGQPYPMEFRVKAVRAVVDRGGEIADDGASGATAGHTVIALAAAAAARQQQIEQQRQHQQRMHSAR